jgi:transporter family-2 protein
MLGIICSIIAGISMSIQGVFNTRLGERIGQWETNVWVQGSGLVVTLIVLMFAGKGSFRDLRGSNKLYLLGGALGVIIIYTVMQGIKVLGATHAVGVILIAQLATAALIDMLGLFDSTRVPFHICKVIGLCIMILGIVIFKWKG